MHTVDAMIEDILRREGGFTKDSDDPAHNLRRSKGHQWDSYCTNLGVTQYTLSNYWGRQATMAEVMALTEDEAAEIYRYEYFHRPRFNELHKDLQPIMFDMGVNHGPKQAVKLLQGLCTKAGYPLVRDGRIGFKTNKASRAALVRFGGYFINALVEERIKFYQYLIRKNPLLSKYRRGWMRRANEFLFRGSGDHVARNLVNDARLAA